MKIDVSAPGDEVRIDESAWPVVLITYPRRIENAALERVLEQQTRLVVGGTPFALIIDMSAGAVPNAYQRKRLAEHMNHHRDQVQRTLVAMAMVVNSPLVRGAITAINWFKPPEFPMKLCGTLAEAQDWVRGMMARRGASAG